MHAVIGGETLSAAAAAVLGQVSANGPRHSVSRTMKSSTVPATRTACAATKSRSAGRIVALADVYDALTTARVYKPAYSHEVAKNIILEGNGEHFDPEIVDAFLENEERISSKFVANSAAKPRKKRRCCSSTASRPASSKDA